MGAENENPLCKCGCGAYVGFAKRNDKRKGVVKGQPLSFIRGHSQITHGQAGHKGNRSPTYRSWAAMKTRCGNPKAKDYAYYGGRGIRVCDRWKSFENFLADMGERPEGCTIERKNTDGAYESENCTWALQLVQVNNSSHNHMLAAFGRTQSIADWSRQMRIPRSALAVRIARGWPAEEALTSPVRPGLARTRR